MKLFKLLRNEFIKIFAKKSVLLVLLLALALSATLPILQYRSQMDDDDFTSINEEEYRRNLLDEITHYTDDVENLEAEDKNSGYYYSSLFWARAYMSMLQLKYDAGVTSWEDWRDNFSYRLTEFYQELWVTEAFADKDKKLMEAFNKEGLSGMVDGDALSYYYEKDSTKKLKARVEYLEEQIEAFTAAIMNNDTDYINNFNVTEQQQNIDRINDNIASLQKQRKTLVKENYKGSNDDYIKEIDRQIAEAQDSLPQQEEVLKWLVYKSDMHIYPSYTDWRNRCMNEIDNAVYISYQKAMTKEEYDESGGRWNDMGTKKLTYEEYIADDELKKAQAVDIITLNRYYIDNDITPLEYTNSTRNMLESSIYYMILIVAFVGIIVTGPIVSREYSKGTIRLLLIRPVRRWKVLLSKLLAVVLICILTFALCCSLCAGLTVYFFGMEDLSLPIVSITNGQITTMHILERIVPAMLWSCLTILFLVSVAFSMTTIAKSSIMSVGLPLILMAASYPAALILSSYQYYTIVRYSFLPYILLFHVLNNTGTLMQVFGASLELSAQYGELLLGGMSFVLLLLSFIVFSSRDVKN